MTKYRNISAIILAGGKSSRMGYDKAFIKIGGKAIIERTTETLKPLFDEIIIVANEPAKYSRFDLKVVKDIKPDCGPLSGIHSGLVNSDTQFNFVVACDMPFLNPSLIKFLCLKIDGYDGVVPIIKDKPQPLHAIYSKSLLPLLEDALEGGDYALHTILNKANIKISELSDFKERDGLQLEFRNINDEKDLKSACRDYIAYPPKSYNPAD